MQWPDGFMWGTGASSTQCEGAAPASDYIDRERAGKVPASGDGNGFAARHAEDFAIYKSLGLDHHRLSIEWARVEPENGRHDPGALEHYRNVLQAAHDTGITPWITLHHFTLPRWFMDEGGFLVEANRTNYWARHVDFMAEAFGDLAGGWKPVNETNYYGMIYAGRAMGESASRADQAIVDEAIHLATCEVAATLKQTGKPVCSIYGLATAELHDDLPETRAAADAFYKTSWDPGIGLFRDGVLQVKGRPPVERPDLAGCFDIIGFSYYASFGFANGKIGIHPSGAEISPLGYGIWADGVGKVLDRLHSEIPGVALLVSEYGIGTDDDDKRAAYITRGLEVTNDAIGRGIDVRGFFHWTGVDNYEWTHGYDVKFGIVDADRNVRPSAQVLRAQAQG